MKNKNILDTILETKHKEVQQLGLEISLAEARDRALTAPATRDFFAALTQPPRGKLNLIAEVKKASPSAGVIREDFDPVAIATEYAQAGANAISVLTDEQYFQGKLEYLQAIRQAVDIPLLRKDFLIDPLQVYEARYSGADAILLIAGALEPAKLQELLLLANELSMACLVEVHNSQELQAVLPIVKAAEGNLLGINNRDLTTFHVDIATTANLIAEAGTDIPVVSESGIKTHADVEFVANAGARAILVGQSLVQQDNIVQGLRSLVGIQAD